MVNNLENVSCCPVIMSLCNSFNNDQQIVFLSLKRTANLLIKLVYLSVARWLAPARYDGPFQRFDNEVTICLGRKISETKWKAYS